MLYGAVSWNRKRNIRTRIEISLWSLVNYWSHNQMILLRRFKMAIEHKTSRTIFFFWLSTFLFYSQRINHCHRNKMVPLFPWKFLQQLSLAPPHPQEESQTNLFVQHLIGYLDRRKPSTAGNHKSWWMINSVLFQNGNDTSNWWQPSPVTQKLDSAIRPWLFKHWIALSTG